MTTAPAPLPPPRTIFARDLPCPATRAATRTCSTCDTPVARCICCPACGADLRLGRWPSEDVCPGCGWERGEYDQNDCEEGY